MLVAESRLSNLNLPLVACGYVEFVLNSSFIEAPMKLTKRGEYALRALIDMVLAREAGRELIPLKEISAREKIPLPFLEQIFRSVARGRHRRWQARQARWILPREAS